MIRKARHLSSSLRRTEHGRPLSTLPVKSSTRDHSADLIRKIARWKGSNDHNNPLVASKQFLKQ